ncbi:type IX secretion system outer membrane channel protein PorV [Labilibacter marinus]|uniref:type IX secretion system outer membrane channel protein PorV n=1 Tax=Labilibacter marinus TaxID=1477105 RepID=UPI00094FFBE3|nr:type IX secretion system outer membrane channel protein PorV [Labilibacter marinus]
MRNFFFRTLVILSFLIITTVNISAQIDKDEVVPTAAPFLTISPESRGSAMGDAGVATAPDINSQHWNSSKYAFLDQDMGVSLSYTPWLRDLVDDINLYYLTFFKRIDKRQTFSASLRYFSLGTIYFQESEGAVAYTGKPNEFALDAAYSLKLSDVISGSVALRYIRSDINNGSGTDAVPGNAYAADINFFYMENVKWGGRKGDVSAGLNISNLGSKISYDGGSSQEFLPANLRLGGAYSTAIDRYNKVGFTLDINRPMVAKNADGEDNSDLSSISSFFSSFGDFKFTDLRFSVGGEYWYNEQFAVRAGYYHEDEIVGNRKFATAGAGLKFNMFTIDASYLISVAQNNPLANTIRFTLGFDLDQVGR